MRKRAVALMSGGIDSALACKVALDLGIEIHGLFIKTVFFIKGKSSKLNKAEKCANILNIPITIKDYMPEYMEILRHPAYGYGKNFNPCIDCHIFFLKKAKELW